MAQLQHLEQSAVVAGLVEQALRARVKMSPRAIQQAPFRVLVGANMPAVLVELGFISNPKKRSCSRRTPTSCGSSTRSSTRSAAIAPSSRRAARAPRRHRTGPAPASPPAPRTP